MTEEEAKQFGAEHNIFTVETSAKTGSNVELAFSAITQEVSALDYFLLLSMLFIFKCLLVNINKYKKLLNVTDKLFLDLSEDKKWWISNGGRLGWHKEWLFTSFS